MENTTISDRAVTALRKSGHYLHHSAGPANKVDNETLLAALSDEEKETLAVLLEKCLQSWNGSK